MTESIVIEKVLPHPIKKVWRALTEKHLLADWLMETDFQPIVGHRFTFRMKPMPHWNGVTDCEVTEVTPMVRLAYTWCSSGDEAENGLRTSIVWTLEPSDHGTKLRMEQSGFRADQGRAKAGAGFGWHQFLNRLDEVLSRNA